MRLRLRCLVRKKKSCWSQMLRRNFYGKAAPHQFFGSALKRGTYRQGGSHGHVLLLQFFLERLSSDDLVPPLAFSLLLFFTLIIRTVNQAVLNPPLATVHIYVPEKNGILFPSSSHARRGSHSSLQRARRAFRHLQPRSSNGISAILSERGTALLHWQSFG